MLDRFPGCAGVDEAGRGPMAGPVVAAAVILPAEIEIKGLNDSKKLTREQRESLEVEILAKAIYSLSFVDNREIDELNILWASMAAMSRAIHSLSQIPTMIYVDGNRLPKDIQGEAVIKGDGKIAEIAAASILAKVARDRYMVEVMHPKYPQYGFDRHFGYPTPDHFETLNLHGPCEIHRFSYAPVQALLQPVQTSLF
jgi:ribonuclease HII